MAYFERLGPDTYRPTEHVSGAWDITTQHIGPALGLLVHQIQQDLAARRDDPMVISRLGYELLGVVPMDVVDTTVEVIRPGRTIELVEATYGHGERTGIRVRAWLQQPRETGRIAGVGLEGIPRPEEMPEWDPTTLWDGGYLASAQVRRTEIATGHSEYWVRTDVPLLGDEPVSDLARAAALFDIANGMAVRADPTRVHFPNIDLTAHLVREPRGPWVGFETRVTFGPGGLGLTSSVIHDLDGPVGTVAQSLTVRPG
ncbi:thioesterase family protein [Dietzia aerolata]|uniref:Thioesterase family protein n=1 Tax=Dietzia aerolata TaxID=595984 RepID=A0ABV5JUE1_9ACTN|nr:thioesterase family protein [Dietzia aerolata]MBB0967602.1 thioesterase family protein [Dietzia aerolata]